METLEHGSHIGFSSCSGRKKGPSNRVIDMKGRFGSEDKRDIHGFCWEKGSLSLSSGFHLCFFLHGLFRPLSWPLSTVSALVDVLFSMGMYYNELETLLEVI